MKLKATIQTILLKSAKSIGVAGLIICINPDLMAQDVHFSQFYENAILRNPALTGIFSGDYKAGVNYRSQWSSVDANPFMTVLASAEGRVSLGERIPDCFSFGLTAVYDRSNSIDFTTTQVYPALNYNKFIESRHNTFLSLGFTFGYIQRSVDVSKMTFANQYANGSYSASNSSRETLRFMNTNNFDLGFGLSLNSSFGKDNRHNYFIGGAYYHVTTPSLSFREQAQLVKLAPKYNFNYGMKLSMTENSSVLLHLNYVDQNPYREIIGGGLVSWKDRMPKGHNNLVLYAGLFYRYQDAFIPTVKVDFNNYSINVSYDINNSSARRATNGWGGYEISLFCKGFFQNNNHSVRCPRFEDQRIEFQ